MKIRKVSRPFCHLLNVVPLCSVCISNMVHIGTYDIYYVIFSYFSSPLGV